MQKTRHSKFAAPNAYQPPPPASSAAPVPAPVPATPSAPKRNNGISFVMAGPSQTALPAPAAPPPAPPTAPAPVPAPVTAAPAVPTVAVPAPVVAKPAGPTLAQRTTFLRAAQEARQPWVAPPKRQWAVEAFAAAMRVPPGDPPLEWHIATGAVRNWSEFRMDFDFDGPASDPAEEEMSWCWC